MSVTLPLRYLSTPSLLAALALVAGCSSEGPPNSSMGGQAGMNTGGMAGGGVAGAAGSSAGMGGMAGGGAGGVAGAAGIAGTGGGLSGCIMYKNDDDQPLLLSATGCVDMTDPSKAAAGLVPYSVRSPLWSDAAAKERFMRIPDGTKIHAVDCVTEPDLCKAPGLGGQDAEDGHWELPIGTVLVKNFSIEDKHVETRLLMRRTMTVWAGFSYEWNAEQTEAKLIPDNLEFAMGKDVPVGSSTQVWHYPSRTQCLECHTRYAGRSLGPSTPQLNSDFAYPEGSMNQIEKFQALGLFDAPPKDIAGYPDPFGADPLEQRARSYMRTNCAICHRPGGEYNTVDLRFATPIADTKLCEVVERDMGKVPLYRLVPGEPINSSMSFRMHALDELRMPKVGSNVVDTLGSKLVDDWITALPANSCPNQQ